MDHEPIKLLYQCSLRFQRLKSSRLLAHSVRIRYGDRFGCKCMCVERFHDKQRPVTPENSDSQSPPGEAWNRWRRTHQRTHGTNRPSQGTAQRIHGTDSTTLGTDQASAQDGPTEHRDQPRELGPRGWDQWRGSRAV